MEFGQPGTPGPPDLPPPGDELPPGDFFCQSPSEKLKIRKIHLIRGGRIFVFPKICQS